MKIGVLYPRSKAHPEMMGDFVDGIRSVLKYHEIADHIRLITESIGFGAQEKEVYEKAEKLLILEDADILLAYIDMRVLPLLEPLMNASGKLMIVVNAGANYPENWVPQPTILYLTLQHSFLCWLTGTLAARNKRRQALVATSFYDAGYLHIAAVTKSFINNGGSLTYNYINKDLYNETFEIKPLIDFLSADKETVTLLCVFDVKPAALFYERLNQYEESSRLHLYVSPMMLEQKAGETHSFNFSVEGYLPYHSAAENKSNTEFRDSFTAQTKREPSLFALQGWEAGLILREIFTNCKDNYAEGSSVKDHLITSVIDSPRGKLALDGETHYFKAPVFKAMIENNSGTITISPADNREEEWKKMLADPLVGPTSGWMNTYLCY